MKMKKAFSVLMIFVLTIMLIPQDIFACDLKDNCQSLDAGSDAVLAYYDVKTQTETLITEDELQAVVSSAQRKRSVDTAEFEPQSASEPQEQKLLTKKEKQMFDDAKNNTLEYYGESQKSTRAIDNRSLVSNPQADPYYRIAKLYFSETTNAAGTQKAGYMGTGFAVGPNLCATARHCLTDSYGKWVTDFKAYYGYNGYNNTYSNCFSNVSGYIYYPQYITGTNADGTITTDSNYDVAYVIWGERTVEKTGCFGMSSAISNGMNLRTAGYPGDRDNGYRMYEAYGSVTSYTDQRLSCDNIYCAGGQSGSPYFDNDYYAHGILTHTRMLNSTQVSGESSGRRYDYSLIVWLQNNNYV